MKTRPTVTAAIIALDEERNLPGLFDSLAWVDEIVVIDGGSRDGTLELARRGAHRVGEHRFDTFARQRNRAIELARGDWVLSIDADERATPALADEVRQAMADDRFAAYRVPIRSRIFGRPFRYAGTQDDLPLRLFRRQVARWEGAVHERLRVTGRVGRLRQGLTHETLPSLSAFLAKMNRYTALAAQARVDARLPPRWWDQVLAPPVEVGRRLFWKHGWLDGPAGWTFCLLSGLSQWVLADRHRRLWRQQTATHETTVHHVSSPIAWETLPTGDRVAALRVMVPGEAPLRANAGAGIAPAGLAPLQDRISVLAH